MTDRGRKISTAIGAIGGFAALTALAGCGGGSTPSSTSSSISTNTVGATASSQTPDPLAVPGIPDPCALLPAAQVLTLTHIATTAKIGSVASAAGGRTCAFNKDRPDELQVSLTPVSKAGFDAYRALAQGKLTDLKGIGQEAYSSSDTPGVVDVFTNGFDLNVWVTHATDATQEIDDAKALAAALAVKIS
jgi:hypothetical protein